MSGFVANPQQKQAIDHTGGPLLVSAGAGSGKTKVLVKRIVSSLLGTDGKHRLKPGEILTITFTEKAATKLKDDVASELRAQGHPETATRIDEMWISTIHAMCGRILRANALEMRLDPDFRILDETAERGLKVEAFEEALLAYSGQVASAAEDVNALELYTYPQLYEMTRILYEHMSAGKKVIAHPAEADPEALLTDAKIALADVIARFEQIDGISEENKYRAKKLAEAKGALSQLAEFTSAFAGPRDLETREALRQISVTIAGYADENMRARKWDGYEEHLVAQQQLRDIQDSIAEYLLAPYAAEIVELATVFSRTYERMKQEANVLDYNDLQVRTLELFERFPDVQARYRDKFQLVQIDEFQDTDELQLELVERIGGDSLCCVGDAQQSIYGFRGADLNVYKRYATKIEEVGGTHVQLTQNYRSHQAILEATNDAFKDFDSFQETFLELEHGRAEKVDPIPDPGSSPRVNLDLYFNPKKKEGQIQLSSDEAKRVIAFDMATRIKELLRDGWKPKDIVILSRAFDPMKTYLAALTEQGIDAVISGGGNLLEQPTIILLENFVRVLANPRDEKALVKVLSSSMFRMGDEALLALTQKKREQKRSLYEVLFDERSPEGRILSGEAHDGALGAANTLDECFSKLGKDDLSTVIRSGVERSGLDLCFLQSKAKGRQQYAFFLRFLQLADDFEKNVGGGAAGFAESLKSQRDLKASEGLSVLPDEENMPVRLMTIHSSKGLEFPIVFVPDLQKKPGTFGPSIQTFEDEDTTVWVVAAFPAGEDKQPIAKTVFFERIAKEKRAAEEEELARLLYVAMTRAREKLYLSGQFSVTSLEEAKPNMLGSAVLQGFINGAVFSESIKDTDQEDREPTLIHTASGDVIACWAHPLTGQSLNSRNLLQPIELRETPDFPGTPITPSQIVVAQTFSGLTPAIAPSRISYSGFSAYLECGRRFQAERLFRVGELHLEESRGEATELGSAFHALAERIALGDEVGDGEVERIARYHDIVDEDTILRLSRAVANWKASDVARQMGIPQNAGEERPTCKAEVPFGIRLKSEAGEVVLDGSIDLLALDGTTARIVDYKTGGLGAAGQMTEAQLKGRYRLQAECYALALLVGGKTAVEVVFVRPEVTNDDGSIQRVTFVFTQADKGAIEQKLLALFASMKQGRYEPLETYEREVCGTCPIAGTICEVGRPRFKTA